MCQSVEGNNAMKKIEEINKIEGFDPSPLAVDLTDLETGETRRRLPVSIQMAWFRLRYPEGKITVKVIPSGDCFVATARVYPNYKDPEDYFLGEGTASRGPCKEKPSVSPREWAQTAAIGVALRNAGFGLQFSVAGEDFPEVAPNELGESSSVSVDKEKEDSIATSTNTEIAEEPKKELTLEEKYQEAIKVTCPLEKYKDKSLGDLIKEDPKLLNWLATKFERDQKVKEAAQVICEYALNVA